ncbi:MAG: DUF488 domain-containing protein, partial [Chloroflexi bacterium]|nr:DUF488 domain-containing protein [Chloroflexota bacterium]
QHEIAVLVDVRSQPYSQWVPQFNRESLCRALEAAGVHYIFMGESLGGRPADRSLYHPGEERPDYERLRQSTLYQTGIAQLVALATQQRVALMCSEGDYHKCHRSKLITPTLLGRGVRVLHILPDGIVVEAQPEAKQLSLF